MYLTPHANFSAYAELEVTDCTGVITATEDMYLGSMASNCHVRVTFDGPTITVKDLAIGIRSGNTNDTDVIVTMKSGTLRATGTVLLPSASGKFIFEGGDMYLPGDLTNIASSNGFEATGTEGVFKASYTQGSNLTWLHYVDPVATVPIHQVIPKMPSH
jgi:hypothetical protein